MRKTRFYLFHAAMYSTGTAIKGTRVFKFMMWSRTMDYRKINKALNFKNQNVPDPAFVSSVFPSPPPPPPPPPSPSTFPPGPTVGFESYPDFQWWWPLLLSVNLFIFRVCVQTCFFPNLLASAVDAQLVGDGFVFFERLGVPALTVGDAEIIGIEKFDAYYFFVKNLFA